MQEPLVKRVVQAAETALADQQYVSAIDVLQGMRLLAPSHVEAWRKGRIEFLGPMVQGHPQKISRSMEIFRQWVLGKGLRASEAPYVRTTRMGTVQLQFSASGDPETEKFYRTHFVSPALPQRKQQRIEQKLSQAPQPVVFQIIRASQCSECAAELESGEFLYMEAEQPLCLACARLDDLEYLPAGDTALTRRASKYSGRTAVVVRFSRSRKRYERQGLLIEKSALEKAEQECTEDAGQRAAARARAAELRCQQDREFVAQLTEQLKALFPGCPLDEARSIAAHTAVRGSGRVGRTAGARDLEEEPLTLAVAAAIRHTHTDYDLLLARGMDRADARHLVAGQVDDILEKWRA